MGEYGLESWRMGCQRGWGVEQRSFRGDPETAERGGNGLASAQSSFILSHWLNPVRASWQRDLVNVVHRGLPPDAKQSWGKAGLRSHSKGPVLLSTFNSPVI